MVVVVRVSEDGDVSVEAMSESDLAARLAEDYYGPSPTFLTSPPGTDPQYWPARAMLVIRAEAIVVPEPEQVVTRWRV